MLEQKDYCEICFEPTANPLCNFCLSKHIIAHLIDKKIYYKKIISIAKGLRSLSKYNNKNSRALCVICKRRVISICIYCWLEKSKKILEKNLNNKANKIFENDFDNIIFLN